MDTITIPKKLSKNDDLIVVRRKDFEAFQKWQREVKDALAKVRRGRSEYQSGKTSTVSSPRALR